MKQFNNHRFNPGLCRLELDALKALLDGYNDLEETIHVRPFFESHLHAAAFVGRFAPDIIAYDLIAHQLAIGGDFVCDLAIGDSKRLSYCLVEFEDATADSVFRKSGKKATRDWSPRFEHGLSQIVDWFYRLEDMKQTNAFDDLFGRGASYCGILVVGRRQFLSASEQKRLTWRQEKVLVDSRQIFCLTYDDLYAKLDDAWNRYDPGYYASS